MEQKIDKKNSYPFGITSSTTVHVIGEVVAYREVFCIILIVKLIN